MLVTFLSRVCVCFFVPFGALFAGLGCSLFYSDPGRADGPGSVLLGVGMLVTAWTVARLTPGAYSVNGIGTQYFGRIESPEGAVMTKWLAAFVPILPVRSEVVYAETPIGSGYMEIRSALVTAPLPGLGLSWRSVWLTAGRSLAVVAGLTLLFGLVILL